jgi:hypothetical protein
MGINYIKTRKNHTCYGMGLGIIVLDDPYPGFPGDVRNASAFPFPIQYEIAKCVDNHTLVWEEDKSPCLEPIKQAANNLERMGCRAIAAECGYFAYFQKDMIAVCTDFCKAHPGIGALMLEYTGMQPFARAIQRVADIPVFSWGTLLDYAYSVVVHREYYGHV